ncbi:MAG: DUF3667 domain-containing protein [Phenylobacterium sp.]|nr:DUF3667 domain-containing protein [Phenylobacterium sp.]
MSEFDAVGGAATGGLMAAAVETPTGHAGEPHNLCADCGTETVGRFCHNCGNAAHVHRTLLHLGEELLHGVMHFDSRAWRTLPRLAFRPGQLTREWSEGKRARYVSPLAMFLFTVFVIFMLLSYLPVSPAMTAAEQRAAAAGRLAQERTRLANAEAAVKTAPDPARRAELEGDVRAARANVDEAREALEGVVVNINGVGADVGGDNWMAELGRQARSGELKIDTGDAKLDKKVREKLENPEFAIYKLQQTFYKFSFLLAPISIPFVALLFVWKRGFTLYDHGVFVLYSLTFMSMLLLALALLGRVGGGVATAAVTAAMIAAPLHMFFQLKGAYGLGVFSALWRTALLLVFCTIALAFFLVAILWLGMV